MIITANTISTIHFVDLLNQLTISVFIASISIIDIFLPQWGKPVSLQSLRCSPFEVVHYIFRGHGLAFAAIPARE
jgi:hypothetical protein